MLSFKVAHSGSRKAPSLRQQRLVHLHLPLWKTLETDSEQDVDLTHLVYATEVCSQAC